MGPTITHPREGTIEARVSLPGRLRAPGGLIVLTYTDRDPLVVTFSIRTPDGEPAIQRVLLRSDLTAVTSHAVVRGDVTLVPLDRRNLRVLIGAPPVELVLARAVTDAFIAETHTIVPPTDEAETEAVSRAVATFLDGFGNP